MKTKLYFAYGMNTNKDEMSYRCPSAKPLGLAVLPGYRFEFKGRYSAGSAFLQASAQLLF